MIDVCSPFAPPEADRIAQCIDALVPHLVPQAYAFVGSLATRYQLAQTGREYPHRPLNDLDISLKTPAALSPHVTDDFRIAHYHPQDSYWALVEPSSRLKVDVFEWLWPGATVTQAPYKQGTLPIQSVEDELAKKVYGARRILEGVAVDPKQFSDARLLLPIADLEKAHRALTAISPDPIATPLPEALQEAQQAADAHPELVVAKSFRRPGVLSCDECVSDPTYPLTPLSEIYDILYFA
jgi:hypothetical protein